MVSSTVEPAIALKAKTCSACADMFTAALASVLVCRVCGSSCCALIMKILQNHVAPVRCEDRTRGRPNFQQDVMDMKSCVIEANRMISAESKASSQILHFQAEVQ